MRMKVTFIRIDIADWEEKFVLILQEVSFVLGWGQGLGLGLGLGLGRWGLGLAVGLGSC